MSWLRGNFEACVVALICCCATAAVGQSVSEEVSPQVVVDQSDVMPSAAIDSQVHAGYSSMAVASGWRSTGGASWSLSRMGLSSRNSLGNNRAPATRAWSPEAAPYGMMRYEARGLSSRLTPRRLGQVGSKQGLHNMASGTACLGMGGAAGEHSPACGSRGVRVSGMATYSEGFADSTRGTALISPPDTGTSSPLEWSPSGVGGGELSFMPGSFLNPSLHVGTGILGQPGGSRRRSMRAKSASEQPGLSPLQSPLLQGNALGQTLLAPGLLNSGSQGTGSGVLSSPLDMNSGLDSGLNQQ